MCRSMEIVPSSWKWTRTISIDLHIVVDNNVNLNAVGASIIEQVRYEVTRCTGTEVRAVNVYIDSMMIG